MKIEQRIQVAQNSHQLLLDLQAQYKNREFAKQYNISPVLTNKHNDLSFVAEIANDEDGPHIMIKVENENLLPTFSVILWVGGGILLFSALNNIHFYIGTSDLELQKEQQDLESLPKEYLLVLQALLMELGKM